MSQIQKAPRLLSATEAAVKVKQEKVVQVFKRLKCQPLKQVIELDSPIPSKRSRAERSDNVPMNPSLPGLRNEEDVGDFPGVGEQDALEAALEQEMDNMLNTQG